MELQFAEILHGFNIATPMQSLHDIARQYVSAVDEESVEGHVWGILEVILRDAEATQKSRYNADAILAGVHPKRAWSVPHKALLQELVQARPALRRAVIVLGWLERTAPPFSLNVNTNIKGYHYTLEKGSAATDSIDIGGGEDGAGGDLEARDKAHEEALLDAMLRCVRRGDFSTAVEVASKRGMYWRCAVIESCLLGGGDVTAWTQNTETVPLFGEFVHPGVPEGPPPTDAQRSRVLSTIYRTLHTTSSERYQALHNALHGALCGDLDRVLKCMSSWRDKLWAVLRCHIILILMRHVQELPGAEGTHESYAVLLSQYGTGNWKQRAEDTIVAAAQACVPDSFGSGTEAMAAHVVLAVLTQQTSYYIKALEICANQVSIQRPIFAMHFADLLSRAFEQRAVGGDVQSSGHYSVILRAYWQHTLMAARSSPDAFKLHHAPLYFLTSVRDPKRRTQLLAEYLRMVRVKAAMYLSPAALDTAQENMFGIVSQLISLRTLRPADEGVADLREAIANLSAGEEAAPPSDAVMWLSLAITPAHSERAIRQALKELRAAVPRWTSDSAATAKEILNVTLKKVVPPFETRIEVEHEDAVVAMLSRLRFELKLWELIVLAIDAAGAPGDVVVSSGPPSTQTGGAYGRLIKGKEGQHRREELVRLVGVITTHLGQMVEGTFEPDALAVISSLVGQLCTWYDGALEEAFTLSRSKGECGALFVSFLQWVDNVEAAKLGTRLSQDVLRHLVTTSKRLGRRALEAEQLLLETSMKK